MFSTHVIRLKARIMQYVTALYLIWLVKTHVRQGPYILRITDDWVRFQSVLFLLMKHMRERTNNKQ